MNPILAWFDARDALVACWSRGPFDADMTAIAKYREQMIRYERDIRRAARPFGMWGGATGAAGDAAALRWVEWDAAAAARG